MAYSLEEYINKSKQLQSLRAALRSPSLDVNTMYQNIMTLKEIQTNTNFHKNHFEPNIKRSLKMIKSYNEILRDIEEEVSINFDTKNTKHQDMLFQVLCVILFIIYYFYDEIYIIYYLVLVKNESIGITFKFR